MSPRTAKRVSIVRIVAGAEEQEHRGGRGGKGAEGKGAGLGGVEADVQDGDRVRQPAYG
ncbi:hypothetical protein GCM10027157_06420 [Corynebacterium aquatimens]